MKFFTSAPPPPAPSAADLLALERREILVEMGEAPEEAVKNFVREVKRARKDECIVLPPGRYPFPQLHVPLAFRAQRPGSVWFMSSKQAPAMVVPAKLSAVFDGVGFKSLDNSTAVFVVKGGTAALRECTFDGGLEIRGASAGVLLEGCRVANALLGADAGAGSALEVNGTCFAACHFGINAMEGSKVVIRGARFESCRSEQKDDPGAGVNASGTALEIEGTLFEENDLCLHLQNCGAVNISSCRFEGSTLASLMLDAKTTAMARNCAFAGQRSRAYPHAIVSSGGSRFDFCTFDGSAAVPSPATVVQAPPAEAVESPVDDFSQILHDVSEITIHAESRLALENWLHLAHASQKRREQGLPVPSSGRHLVFEDAEEILRLDVADIVARAAACLSIVPNATVAHAPLQNLLFSDDYADRTVEAARGGVLVVYSDPENENTLAREQLGRVRTVVSRVAAFSGEDTLLVLSGGRDFLRPLVRGDGTCRTLFGITIPFPPLTPPELTLVFLRLCARQQMAVTPKALAKVLLVMHLLDDRKDRRFVGVSGASKFFELSQRRYLERCSRERDFQSPMQAGDIESPIDRSVEVLLRASPSFVATCPRCRAFVPWMPDLPPRIQCPACANVWSPEVGIWTGSSFYKQMLSDEVPLRKSTPRIFRRGPV